MAVGPGKYDEALTVARQLCGARGALLIVIDGESGNGFSCQADIPTLARLPFLLREIATQMEADLKAGET